ncbi:imelysin family protein [Mucilaginibacter sp. UR6-1]|uniref:imelysin family protein n=1 Tax=Mucilaginibacter sp. UR6-1 TaxID=1435643 RepID=UPI001E309741|nr:imelysin family protein [Mucilaginibacter sp. UR6-1]MCC8411198.1 imelysin family protein [Mucilaginibacter sp. UR6-1]
MKTDRIKAGLLITVLAATFFIIACSKKSGTDNGPVATNFDKGAMLTNYADNLIIPAYTDLQTQIAALETAANTFLATPNADNQLTLKVAFRSAYLQYQHVSVNQFGPAESVLLNNFLNTFPTDNAVIDGNITKGTYNLAQNSSIDQQGFPALDYVLFSPGAVAKFNGTEAAKRKKYTEDLLARMKTLTKTVLDNWNNTYRAQFTGNTRSDAGSPIAFLINQFAFEMDQMKGPRIGWPFGKQSGGTQFPENTEGYNAGISVALAVENLTNLKRMFTGNNSGKGTSDYLVALNQKPLNDDVLSQFDKAINSLKAIPDPLSTALTNNKTEIEAAYREVQLLLTLIKTDVASATGVRITYQDTDGD